MPKINKELIQNFIDGLIIYDYMLFGGVFVLFILFILLAILSRNKTFFATIFILLAVFTLFVSPFVGYIQLHKYLFKHDIEMTSQLRLHYTQAVVIKGTITNKSKINFTSCKIVASTYKVGKNKYRNYLLKFKPFQKMSIVEEDILVGQKRSFKMIMEPFTYKKDYNVSLSASCKGVVR